MRMNLCKFVSRILVVALSSVPATLLARLHDLPISDPLEARRSLPVESKGQSEMNLELPSDLGTNSTVCGMKADLECHSIHFLDFSGIKLIAHDAFRELAVQTNVLNVRTGRDDCSGVNLRMEHDVPGQTYRGLYRNEYLISTTTAEFNDDAADWNLSALEGQWNQSSILSAKAGSVGPEFFQPLFVIYRLEGKDFLIPASKAKHWNCVPSFNALAKPERTSVEKVGLSQELCDRIPKMIADQLELTARQMLVWAAKLREMKGSRDVLQQVANLLEEQQLQK